MVDWFNFRFSVGFDMGEAFDILVLRFTQVNLYSWSIDQATI